MARETNRISLYEAIRKRQGWLGKGLKPAAPEQKPLGETLQIPPALKQPKPETPAEKTRIIDRKKQVPQTRPPQITEGKPDAVADKSRALDAKPQAAQGKDTKAAGAVPQQGGVKPGRIPESARQVVIKGLKKPLTAPAIRKIKETQSALADLWRGLFEDISWLWWAGITAGLVVLVGLVFILGMEYERGKGGALKTTGDSEPVIKVADAGKTVKTVPAEAGRGAETVKQPVKNEPAAVKVDTKKGTNAIAIVAYTKKDDLKPVQEYFKNNGIDTEVIQRSGYYLLLTKEWFDNPDKEGTDGYRMKESIKKIGANYKAPEGYERFGTTPFQDVYGMKMK